MSRASRALQVGAKVFTDYSGRHTEHQIIDRCDDRSEGHSQSGIMFRVAPIVPKSSGAWMDADWFEPVARQAALPAQGHDKGDA